MPLSKLWAGLVTACLLAVLVGAVPAAADPADFYVGTLDTHVPLSCAVVGTGVSGQAATYLNIPEDYDFATMGSSTVACARAIYAFMWYQARGDDGPDGSLSQRLAAEILTGRPDMHDPYQVFVNDMFVSEPALAVLDTSGAIDHDGIVHTPFDSETPGGGTPTGLDSCKLFTRMLLVKCGDNDNSRFMARQANGDPVIGLDGKPVYIQIGGLLSGLGGSTYGSIFLANVDQNGAFDDSSFDARVQHHEEVHSQQWTQYGWNFASLNLSQWAASVGNALYNNIVYGKVQGITVPAWCFVSFEKSAGLQDGNYAIRDEAHGGLGPILPPELGGGPNPLYIAPGTAYPKVFTDSQNAAAKPPEGYCPSTWQPLPH